MVGPLLFVNDYPDTVIALTVLFVDDVGNKLGRPVARIELYWE